MNAALLIAIDEYRSPDVGNLNGCKNDLRAMRAYLRQRFGNALAIQTLEDEQATRAQIIHHIRTHLAQAREDEWAFLYFSGHGSREPSPEAFTPFQGDAQNETLLCHDSRTPGVYDLADKELALLLRELAPHGSRLVLMLDCCHAGSSTRSVVDAMVSGFRHSPASQRARAKETYLPGTFDQLPHAPHLLMAACSKYERAAELDVSGGVGKPLHRGAFTYTLLSILEENQRSLTYRDLINLCRIQLGKWSYFQTPALEVQGTFNTTQAFLQTGPDASSDHSYQVFAKNGGWRVKLGAIHGMPTEPGHIARFDIVSNKEARLLTQAETTDVSLEDSGLMVEEPMVLHTALSYRALPTDLPLEPIPVCLEGDPATFDQLMDELRLPLHANIQWVPASLPHPYRLQLGTRHHQLYFGDTGLPILPKPIDVTPGRERQALHLLARLLLHIARWERTCRMRLPQTQLREEEQSLKLLFKELRQGTLAHVHDTQEITLDLLPGQHAIACQMSMFPSTQQESRYLFLLHLSRRFAISMAFMDHLMPRGEEVQLQQNQWGLGLPKGVHQGIDTFKLIVSKRSLNSFQPSQVSIDDLLKDAHWRDVVFLQEKDTHNWFTREVYVKLLRQRAGVGPAPVQLGRLWMGAHPTFQAGLSLSSVARHPYRFRADTELSQGLRSLGWSLLPLLEGEPDACIIELHHRQGTEALASRPLSLRFKRAPSSDTLPVAISLSEDSTQLLYLGDVEEEAGEVRLSLHRLPASPPDGRRPAGRSFKFAWVGVPPGIYAQRELWLRPYGQGGQAVDAPALRRLMGKGSHSPDGG